MDAAEPSNLVRIRYIVRGHAIFDDARLQCCDHEAGNSKAPGSLQSLSKELERDLVKNSHGPSLVGLTELLRKD